MLQQETRAQQLIRLYGGNYRPKLTYSTTTDLVDILTSDRIYTIAEVNAIRGGSAPDTPDIKGEAIRDSDALMALLSKV